MPSARAALGRFGEAAAAAHLRSTGARLVARNWRCRYGEIDLVAQLGDQVLFVEVRTRRQGNADGSAPEESVGRAKAERLRLLAQLYLETTGAAESAPWRIDVIVVEVDAQGRVARLEQVEGAIEG